MHLVFTGYIQLHLYPSAQCSGHLSCGITLWWKLSQDAHLQAVALLMSTDTSPPELAHTEGLYTDILFSASQTENGK